MARKRGAATSAYGYFARQNGGGDRPWSISYRLCGENHIFVDPRRFVIDFHTKMWQSAPQKTDIYMEQKKNQ